MLTMSSLSTPKFMVDLIGLGVPKSMSLRIVASIEPLHPSAREVLTPCSRRLT